MIENGSMIDGMPSVRYWRDRALRSEGALARLILAAHDAKPYVEDQTEGQHSSRIHEMAEDTANELRDCLRYANEVLGER